MKKLMIATMVAALSAVSFAGACDDTCACTTDCVYAYEFIMLVKSTEGKSTAVVKESPCECTTCGTCCYRKPRMRKYAGFVFGTVGSGSTACASGCGCLPFYTGAEEGLDTFTDWNQLFWDVRTKNAVWDGVEPDSGAKLVFDFVDAIGYQSRETVEAVGTFTVPNYVDDAEDAADGVMTIAGFGTRGRKGNGKIMVRSISGFCAGKLPCYCEGVDRTTDPCHERPTLGLAYGWTVCSDLSMCPDEAAADDITGGCTAAYGKWTLKWNATAQAKLTADWHASVLVKPGYDSSLAVAMDAAGLIRGDEEGGDPTGGEPTAGN